MKILIADDDPMSCCLLESTLQDLKYDVITATNGKEALEIIKSKDSPQIAILDWMMPEMTGIEVCQEIRRLNKEPYTYVLLLTVKNDIDDIVKGMNAGADDYLVKPFFPQELSVRLNAGTRIIKLQEELIFAREELRHQATHDELTGILNRRSIIEKMRQELRRSKRSKQPIGLIIMDIDHFKRINDTYGHCAGDIVLKNISKSMKNLIRPYDAVGRYGGEEFLIVLPETDIDQTNNVALRMCNIIANTPIAIENRSINVTISLGLTAIYEYFDEDKIDMLIQTADQALYMAKENGRNRVEFLSCPSAISGR